MASPDIVSIGVVGTGMVSQTAHLPAIAACPQLRLHAVADHQWERANRIADEYGAPHRYRSHEELLRDPEIDAVVIVVHRSQTAPITLDALSAGKHVLAEKPMALSLKEAERLSACARENGKIYGVGFMKRYDLGTQECRRILEECLATSKLGPLIMARGKNFCAEYVGGDHSVQIPRNLLPDPEPRIPTLSETFDWLLNTGSHTINLIRYLLAAKLHLRHADLRYRDSASLSLECRSVPVRLDFGKSATGKWEESLEFFFRYGRVKLQLTSLKQTKRSASVTVDENVQTAHSTHVAGERLSPNCFTRQMQAFAAAIQGNREALLATGEDALEDMHLLNDLQKFAIPSAPFQ